MVKLPFCEMMENKYNNIIRINQDDMGKEKALEIFNDNIKNTKTILIDFCNLTKDKRSEWFSMAFGKNAWCIFFDTAFEECLYRIKQRKDHPTVKNGSSMLEKLKGMLEIPQLKEGFEYIYRVSKEEEVRLLFSDFKLEIDLPKSDIIKFPRTKHAINLGSATRDDLILTKEELAKILEYLLYIEEKIDGSNLGIFIDENIVIKAQNRSHIIDSTYHPQYKYLDKWLMQHSDTLLSILEPCNEILYGEWLYMKHSLNYISLPDYFIAFDIYNKTTKTFLNRDALEKRLKNTNIQLVPIIAKQKFKNISDIQKLLTSKSQFYDGFVEGIYIRACDDEKTLYRAKLVRKDFKSGNDNKNIVVVNTIKN